MSEIKRNGHGAMDMTQGSPTRLIVLFSLPLLGRRNPVEIMGVAALTPGALLYAFGYFFQIMLP